LFRRRYPDSTDSLESYRERVSSGGVGGGSYG